MAPYPGSYTGEDSDDDEDGRNSPTSSPCELTYNNLFEQVNLNGIKESALEAQKIPKSTQTRIVSREWPRDPKGKSIAPDNSLQGRQAPNGQQLWGETMLDFYRVLRSPDDPKLANLSTLSTGSKLANWMKKHGELEWAVDEIKRAEMEGEPQEIQPWRISDAIEEQEAQIQTKACGWGKSLPKHEGQVTNAGMCCPSNYPAPWPLVPFSYLTERLQHRMPYHQLPQKLVVHDPWKLLTVADSTSNKVDVDINMPWTRMTDITTTYRLELSENCRATMQMAEQASADGREELQEFLLDPPTAASGPIASPINVLHSPPPSARPVKEAHLYLSLAHPAGRGNHCDVYHAELELPREALTPFVMCEECVRGDIKAKLREEDGENGELIEEKWKVKSTTVEIVRDEKRATGVQAVKMKDHSTSNAAKYDDDDPFYVLTPGPVTSRIQLNGPVRPIRTRVPWRNASHPPTCNHAQPSTGIPNSGTTLHPPTAKVRVAAKLSIQNDAHLLKEAENYQEFSPHLFKHFTGFNVIPPLHDPVPVGAVVPQFYGYYVPDDSNQSNHVYQSPILLLEDCGISVDADELNVDDRQECASLFYRLHCDGWTHGSVVTRNILVQPGPINLAPKDRKPDPPVSTHEAYEVGGQKYTRSCSDRRTNSSYRLINFGRSLRQQGKEGKDHQRARAEEELNVGRLFDNRGRA